MHIKLTTINKADFIPWTAEASIFGALRLGGKVLRDGNKETLNYTLKLTLASLKRNSVMGVGKC